MTDQPDTIPVHLTIAEAELFRTYVKHHKMFAIIIGAKVQDLKNGSATLDFNPQGDLMDIKIQLIAYMNRKK